MRASRVHWVRHWQFYVTTGLTLLIATVAGVWTASSFLATRRAELAWKRTESLFQQAQYLETDRDLDEVLAIIEERKGNITVADILSESSALGAPSQAHYQHGLDKLLNLFDRMAYSVFDAHTLSAREVHIFSWYLDAIAEDSSLQRYCKLNGYGDVLRLARVAHDSASYAESDLIEPSSAAP